MDESPQPQTPTPKRNNSRRLVVLLITLALVVAVYLPLRTSRANDRLAQSLMRRDIEGVRGALNGGADPDLALRPANPEDQPQTLLDFVRVLLHRSLRADKNNFKTALMYAASNGDIKAVSELLLHNANVNLRLDNGYSALMYAASKQQSEVAAALLAKGADVHVHTQDGVTPLLFAAQTGRTQTVGLLLAKGADIHEKDLHAQTALLLAAKNRHEETIRLLLAQGADERDLNMTRPAPPVPGVRLIGAGPGSVTITVQGAITTVQAGTTVSLPQQSLPNVKVSPLAIAAMYGSPALLRFSWERAAPDIRQQHAWNLLNAAVQSGQAESVQFLLSQNVPVNPPPSTTQEARPFTRVSNGYDPSKVYTPLHLAAALPTSEIAALLIAHGANVNAVDSFGTTPLLAASSGAHLATLRLLIAHGANVRATERLSGQNALMRGVHDAAVARLLLDHGLDVNAKDLHGRTALMQCYSVPIATLLIEHGADVNAQDELGRTALMAAVQSYQTDEVKLLLQHGADVNRADNKGKTPRLMALNMRATPLISLLNGAGAKH